MKMLKWIALSLTLFCLPLSAQAQMSKSLKGLSRALVIVTVDEVLQKATVDENAIRTSVELKMRTTGLQVVDLNDLKTLKYFQQSDRAIIGVGVEGLKIEGEEVYCYTVKITVTDAARQERQKAELFYPVVWHNDIMGYAGGARLSTIKDAVDQQTDSFCNDYLIANPKPSPVAPPSPATP